MAIGFIECYTPSKDVVTCSVKLDFSELADYNFEGVIFRVAFAEFGNNGIRIADRTYHDNFPTEITLENVVMNSAMYMASKLPIAPRYDVDGDFALAQYERGAFCLSPQAEDVTIQLYYDVNEVVDALPDQVVEGLKFVGANGVVEEGTMPLYDYSNVAADYETTTSNDGFAFVGYMTNKPLIVEDEVFFEVPKEQFGDAKPSDVRAGVKFTSAEGFKTEGTMKNVRFSDLERTVQLDDDDPSGNTLYISISKNYTEGYVQSAGRFIGEVFPRLTIDGNKVTMECIGFDTKIERTVGANVATCTLVFNLASYYDGGDIAIVYTDANGNTVEGILPDGNSAYELTVACNSLFYMSGTDLYFSATAGILTQLVEYRAKGVYRVASQPGRYNVTFDNS